VLRRQRGCLDELLRPDVADGELPFPAEALRTTSSPPPFVLVDHTGAPVSLAQLRGRVVILTGVYASCGYTCPMILGQAKRALAALTEEERAEVVVVGITLDPGRDAPGSSQDGAGARCRRQTTRHRQPAAVGRLRRWGGAHPRSRPGHRPCQPVRPSTTVESLTASRSANGKRDGRPGAPALLAERRTATS
jgi:hypothetical protein